jgi:site-specific recombinase XerD
MVMSYYKRAKQRLQNNTAISVDRILNNYSQYLFASRGLSHRTIIEYCRQVSEFLRVMIKGNRIKVNRIRPKHVLKFILKLAEKRSPRQAQNTTYALRSFFRYLRQTNSINLDLDNILLPVANRKKKSYPEVLSTKQIDQLLKCCDRKSAKGIRDYAILLLMLNLGLRACEVCNLNLDDIDIYNAEVIIRGKGSTSRMPLLKELGKALFNYILHGRPKITINRIFITQNQPLRPITTDGIRSMFGCALKSAGLKPEQRGTHLLRHTFAMQLLKQGATLSEIGTMLRHKDLYTTAIYARADFSKLQMLALPWPIKTKKGGHYE